MAAGNCWPLDSEEASGRGFLQALRNMQGPKIHKRHRQEFYHTIHHLWCNVIYTPNQLSVQSLEVCLRYQILILQL